MAKEFLNNIRRINQEINQKLDEAYRIRCMAEKVTSIISDEPRAGGGVSDKVGTAAMKLIALSEEIDAKTDEYIDRRDEAERFINQITDPDYRLILKHRYFTDKTFEQIAVEMNYTWRHVHRMHVGALKAFKDVIECHTHPMV